MSECFWKIKTCNRSTVNCEITQIDFNELTFLAPFYPTILVRVALEGIVRYHSETLLFILQQCLLSIFKLDSSPL